MTPPRPADPKGPVREITIVGGGTAGWMAAVTLSRLLRGCVVRLVESDAIGTVGVGEATIPALRNWMNIAGVDETEMVRATGATFKLAIEFVDWRRPGSSYMHGFGRIGQDLYWLHPHQLWLKEAARDPQTTRPFDHYALNCLAARRDRFCKPDPAKAGSPIAELDYAYHFDASLLAAHLRRKAEAQGTVRIEGKVAGVERRPEDGFVTTLVLEDGRRVGGELFIDCSGFRSLLIGQALGVPFEDWSRWLLCDRALAAPCARTAPLHPYTRSTAHASGWRWRIPLQHRTGNGIVYASGLMDDDAAAALLMDGLDAPAQADPRAVRFTPGRRARAWEKNVVALGLAGGFLEPLESTSIHLIQTGLLRLLALFPSKSFNAADIAEYNRQSRFEYEDVRDFIIAHYKVTEREGAPFWDHCRTMPVPDSLQERLELFRSSGRFFMRGKAELFREESWVQVLLGQGCPVAHDPVVDTLPDAQVTGFLRDIEDVIDEVAAAMPDHAAFIARTCAAPASAFSPPA